MEFQNGKCVGTLVRMKKSQFLYLNVLLLSRLSHRELLSSGPSGLILSTDDYFLQRDGYRYEAGLLGAAHEWNQNRGIVSLNAHMA